MSGVLRPPGRTSPLADRQRVELWRGDLVVENYQARFVPADRRKNMVRAGGAFREMVADLSRALGEMRNPTSDPAYRERL